MYLITGATGFIGKRLSERLRASHRPFRILTRHPMHGNDCITGNLQDIPSLDYACTGIHTVFHCAGYAHAFASRDQRDSAHHWATNAEGTKNLVEAAARAGAKHFVFLSSVKAMAEPGEICADEHFPGIPLTAYGQSKRAAEETVVTVGKRYGMQAVNLRLAMVYGAGGRGNLERMGGLVQRNIFPPLPETGNHRSMVHVEDVVDVMQLVAEDTRANGRTYIVASTEAPSGRELYDAMRQALTMPPTHWSVPAPVLKTAAMAGDMLGYLLHRRMPLNRETLSRLLESAWYSPARIEKELGWQARIPLAQGLQEMFGNETLI